MLDALLAGIVAGYAIAIPVGAIAALLITLGAQHGARIAAGGAFGWFNSAGSLVAGETALVSVLQDAGAANSYSYAQVAKNGTTLVGQSVFVPPVTTRSLNYIGKTYWNEGMFQGDIAEIVLYNRKLSASEMAAVQSYLAGKYGISIP